MYSPVSGRVAQVCVGGRGLEIGPAEVRAFWEIGRSRKYWYPALVWVVQSWWTSWKLLEAKSSQPNQPQRYKDEGGGEREKKGQRWRLILGREELNCYEVWLLGFSSWLLPSTTLPLLPCLSFFDIPSHKERDSIRKRQLKARVKNGKKIDKNLVTRKNYTERKKDH